MIIIITPRLHWPHSIAIQVRCCPPRPSFLILRRDNTSRTSRPNGPWRRCWKRRCWKVAPWWNPWESQWESLASYWMLIYVDGWQWMLESEYDVNVGELGECETPCETPIQRRILLNSDYPYIIQYIYMFSIYYSYIGKKWLFLLPLCFGSIYLFGCGIGEVLGACRHSLLVDIYWYPPVNMFRYEKQPSMVKQSGVD